MSNIMGNNLSFDESGAAPTIEHQCVFIRITRQVLPQPAKRRTHENTMNQGKTRNIGRSLAKILPDRKAIRAKLNSRLTRATMSTGTANRNRLADHFARMS